MTAKQARLEAERKIEVVEVILNVHHDVDDDDDADDDDDGDDFDERL